MAGKMDRYVAATVAGAYFAALLFLAMMFIVFDLLFEMDSYVRVANEAGTSILELVGQLLSFHALNMPIVFVTIAPFVTVIACMFALSRLMAANEICPMVFTGRSLFRALLPMLTIALISSLTMMATWQWVIPGIADSKESVYAKLTGHEKKLERITLRLSDRKELFCRVYWHDRQRMEGVIVYDRGASRADGVYTQALAADYDPERDDWDLTEGLRISGDSQTPETEKQSTLGLKGVTPNRVVDIGKSERETAELSFTELEALIELRPGKADYVLAYHTHFTFPLANFILILLALPFAVNFERGRRIERVVFSIAICAGYLIMDLTCQNLAYKGLVHPIVAAWTPTIICGSLGTVVFGSMRT